MCSSGSTSTSCSAGSLSARIPVDRADRSGRRDRLRRARVERRPARSAGPTSRTAAPTGSCAATTRPCSATRSARTPGSTSCIRPSCASGRRSAARTAGFAIDRGAATTRRATPSSACAPASCTRSRIQDDAVLMGGAHPDPDYAARREGVVHRRGQLRRGRRHLLLRLDGNRAAGATPATTSR